MKKENSSFDRLVARYYPAVYSFAARFTDDPRDAVALTRQCIQPRAEAIAKMHSQTAIATVLIAAVLRAGLAAA